MNWEQIWQWFDANANAIQAGVALLALLPAALSFAVNQISALTQRSSEKYRNVIARYQHFLELAMQYPELHASGHDEPIALKGDERSQRDNLFQILVSICEEAYIAYTYRISSYRRQQWQGWLDFYDDYCRRSDFREFWARVMGEGSWLRALDARSAQYHKKFVTHIIDLIEKHMTVEERASLEEERAANPTAAMSD